MTSFNSAAATPLTVSDLVNPAVEERNSLQGPIAASIDSDPVQAYAKLEGEDFCYYIRTLQVSLGRKVSNPDNVDIPLGNTKSVSRQHARLFYNFSTQRFELMIFGKNGAFVNEQFVEKGVTVPLENRTKIQIGEMAFVFLLPKRESVNVNSTNNVPQHNIDDFGYISTPHQLEKNVTSTTNSSNKLHLSETSTAAYEDYDLRDNSAGDDDRNEISEIDTYQNKDSKPPYSYATLIAQAINSTNAKRMTLNGIYNYITTNYPYYQMSQNGWQNSIRHNLSLNKAFVKVPRSESEPGKGAFWTISPDATPLFLKSVYKRNKRTIVSSSSTLSSHITTHQHYPTKPVIESARKKVKKEHVVKDSICHKYENEDDLSVINSSIRTEKVLVNSIEKETELNNNKKETVENLPSPAEIIQGVRVRKGRVDEIAVDSLSISPLHNNDIDVSSAKSKVTIEDMIITDEKKSNTSNKNQDQTTISKINHSGSSAKTTMNNSITSDIPQLTNELTTTRNMNQPNNAEVQAQLQLQLQNTIRQHLLDPIRYPLPPSIAQLLPQAIAQLPSELATQLSSTLHSTLKKQEDNRNTASDAKSTEVETPKTELTETQTGSSSENTNQNKSINASNIQSMEKQ